MSQGFTNNSSLASGTVNGVTGPDYHPDRIPESLDASSDEFTAGLSGSWRWGNQGTSTDVGELDTALLTAQAASGNNRRCRWMDAPSAVDFVVTSKMCMHYHGDHNQAGIIVLATGDETTPTKMWHLQMTGSGGAFVHVASSTGYTAANADQTTHQIGFFGNESFIVNYLQIRYVASSKVLGFHYAPDGMTWRTITTTTLADHPISIGRFVNPDNGTHGAPTRYQWFRTRTDATGTSSPYPCGA